MGQLLGQYGSISEENEENEENEMRPACDENNDDWEVVMLDEVAEAREASWQKCSLLVSCFQRSVSGK